MTDDLTWHLLATNPRQEARAQKGLQRLGHGTLLLTHTEKERRRGKWHVKEKLTFPGYLFVSVASAPDWRDIRDVWGVCRVLYAEGRPAIVSARLIGDLQSGMIGGAFDVVDDRESLFDKGKHVRITDGPFASFPALVDALVSHDRARVLVALFGRQSIVEVSLDQLELM